MRNLLFAINTTLDGCVDHAKQFADDETHEYFTDLMREGDLLVFPVLLGSGKRFFAEGTPPRELALVSTKAVSSGVIISTYSPNGPLRTGAMGE